MNGRRAARSSPSYNFLARAFSSMAGERSMPSNRFAQSRTKAPAIPGLAAKDTEIIMAVGIVGLYVQGAFETGARIFPLAQCFEDIAQIVVRIGIIWPERNGAAIAGGRLAQLALCLQHNAQIIVE